jgi:hypothetical protein
LHASTQVEDVPNLAVIFVANHSAQD